MVGRMSKMAGAALALALGTTALAAPALAQDRGDRGGGEHRGGGDRGGGDRGGNWGGRGEGARPDRPAGGWNGSSWNGGGGDAGRPNWNRPAPQPAPQAAPQPPPRPAPQAAPPTYRSYADPGRDRAYNGNGQPPQQGWDGRRWNGQNWNDRDRDGHPDGARRDDGPRPTWQRDRDRGWDSNRGWDRDRGDPRRGSWSAGRPDGRWDRDWRRDSRYNWQAWRDSHREVYRVGRYIPPYRTYGYRRLSIGFFLDGGFFGSNYWIGDPWMYRLPPAYGPYRWVRYYDDALLVDTYTGEVVDVIYDVFW